MYPSTAVASTTNGALKPLSQAALQTMLDTTARELLIPGAVVLLRTPQGEFTATYGTTELGTKILPAADTYFGIASNTKTMTAAVIVQLAQEGKLKFSDPVSKYVAGVPNDGNITIAELLDMRSGLYNYTNAPEFAASLDRDMKNCLDAGPVARCSVRAEAQLRTGSGVRILQYQLHSAWPHHREGRTASRWPSQCKTDCSGRSACSTRSCLPAARTHSPEPYSHGYLYGSSSVALFGEPPYSAATKAAARAGTLKPTDYTRLNHSWAWAAGGAISNADDLATWIQALVSGRVFDAKHQQLWLDSLRPMDPKKPGQEYGYGIIALRWGTNAIYNHGGETAGYQSFMGYDPANKITLIVWTNLTVSLDEIPTANSIRRMTVIRQWRTRSILRC
jgi:D-alanyl-D-alanine carboxypeptidase